MQKLSSLMVVVCVLHSNIARAQDRDVATAQALFEQGRAMMKAGNYRDACPRLAESHRLDPGIGTLFHLADCHEGEGKLASAWAEFLEVASMAAASDQTAREQAARARAARLRPRLPQLVVTVPDQSRVPDLSVMRDGVEVREIQWNTALPVDPGEHRIKARAAGRREFSTSVTASEGHTATVSIPALEPDAAASTTQPPNAASSEPAPAALSSPAPAADDATRSTSSAGPGPWVIGLGVVGIVATGAGVVLGFMAKSKYDSSKEECNPTNENLCNATGVELRDDAFTLGHFSTAGFVVGGLALAGAGVLWIAGSGSDDATTARAPVLHAGIRSNGAGSNVVLGGSF